jgi:predicted Fe-Mo cluster-binding NifX family protein
LGGRIAIVKICVSSTGDTLDSEVDDEFGMCEYFIIIDPDTMEYKAVLNEASHSPTGTGHQAAQAVVDMDVNVVLTGFVGHHGMHILRSAGIRVITGFEGTVRSAVEKYRERWLVKDRK